MQIIPGAAQLPPTMRGAVVVIGNFDGVHLGHQALLDTARLRATALAAPVAVYTFDPHPSAVLAPHSGLQLLQTLPQRLDTLAHHDVATTIVEPFTAAFAAISAHDFVMQQLHRHLGARHIVVGHDFTFGHKRAGHTHDLLQWCTEQQMGCDIVPPVFAGDCLISSTHIRHCVSQGWMEDAHTCLGRPYDIAGTIVTGRGVGRQLGFPTLNLVADNALLPPAGVYITSAAWADTDLSLPAATYIGMVPTFGGTTQVVETYLLRDTPPINLTRLRIGFHRRLRGDIRFPDAATLRDQIVRDVADAQHFHHLPA